MVRFWQIGIISNKKTQGFSDAWFFPNVFVFYPKNQQGSSKGWMNLYSFGFLGKNVCTASTKWASTTVINGVITLKWPKIHDCRAETHERFYVIEVHRHRFEMSARKVPFEKCTRCRKVCGRSAKDQIGDSIYSFFLRFRAKGSRKARERCAKDVSTRAMSFPKWAVFSHAWFWSKGKEATNHSDILVDSIHSCKQQPIYCI